MATVVELLEETRIRIGNEEYAKENGSYGLTTLENRHVDISGSTVKFRFKGKSGKRHEVTVKDRRLARVIKDCLEIPGQELFQYLDEEGQAHDVESEDVNDYLGEIAGDEFTAKDFRTWSGTLLAARFFRDCEPITEETRAAKKDVVRTIARVAEQLGNTPAVCKKCYVHPAVIAAYLAGTLHPAPGSSAGRSTGLSHEEEELLTLLSSASPNQPAQRRKRSRAA
jgi:DNA topoisomerase-1